MTRTLSLFAALALFASASAAGAAPALDAAGKCRDGGKFVAAEKCKGAKPAPKHGLQGRQGQVRQVWQPRREAGQIAESSPSAIRALSSRSPTMRMAEPSVTSASARR